MAQSTKSSRGCLSILWSLFFWSFLLGVVLLLGTFSCRASVCRSYQLMVTRSVESSVVKAFFWFDKVIQTDAGGENRPRVFDSRDPDFSFLKEFEDNYQEIAAETREVLKEDQMLFSDLVPHQDVLNKEKKWSTFPLRVYSADIPRNLARVPTLKGLLEKYSDLTFAQLSILAGPANIPPHRGIFSGVLRVHMGLDILPGCSTIPSGMDYNPDCFIDVGGQKLTWQNGKVTIFDDSLRHFVEVKAKGPRVVLFLDMLRPGLPFWQSWSIKAMMAFARNNWLVDSIVKKAERFHDKAQKSTQEIPQQKRQSSPENEDL